MPRPTSDEIRATVIRLLVDGHSVQEAARLAGITDHTVRSIRNTWETTGTSRRRYQPYNMASRRRKLRLGDVWFMTERISQAPNLYLSEMQDELSAVCQVDLGISTLSEAITRCGITRKKIDK
ncbi:hypothetical protein FRC07_009136 [Ceratobasidium sp. 392]|nr:hypothetical protein FRC07_009136 [Ceratobasidium sp. 392]